MQRRFGVGIVEIEGMGERPIQKRRRGGCVGLRIPRHRAVTGRESQVFEGAYHGGRRFRVVTGTDHDPRGVENQKLGPLDHIGGQVFITQIDCEFRKTAANTGHRMSP